MGSAHWSANEYDVNKERFIMRYYVSIIWFGHKITGSCF